MGLAAPSMSTKEALDLVGGHPHPGKVKDRHTSIKIFSREPFDTPKCGVDGCAGQISRPSFTFPCRSNGRVQLGRYPSGVNEHPILAPLIHGLMKIQGNKIVLDLLHSQVKGHIVWGLASGNPVSGEDVMEEFQGRPHSHEPFTQIVEDR